MPEWFISLKPFLLVVAAIPTGLFVRTVGEWFVTWVKAPKEKAKEEKRKKAVLASLLHAIGNCQQYCDQMVGGLPVANGVATQPGIAIVVPTFNLDLMVLDEHLTEVYSLLTQNDADDFALTRLELTHVRRRIDRLADLLLTSGYNQNNPLHIQHIQGTRALLVATIARCNATRQRLEGVERGIQVKDSNYLRPLLALVIMVLLVAGVVSVAAFPDGKTEPSKQQPEISDLKSSPSNGVKLDQPVEPKKPDALPPPKPTLPVPKPTDPSK